MSDSDLWRAISKLPPAQFEDCCHKILAGLGFSKYKPFSAPDLQVGFRETLIRESTDKMFRTEEPWLITFVRSDSEASLQILSPGIRGAQSGGLENLLLIFFGELYSSLADTFHDTAKMASVKAILIEGALAAALLHDYCSAIVSTGGNEEFSFAKIRERAKKQSEDASWRTQFQSLTAVSAPTRIRPPDDGSALNEADLFRAVAKTGSFLLLGDPGSGKTTSLLVMAEELAKAGPRTPVLLLLNEYSGNLLADLAKTIQTDATDSSETTVQALLNSGVLAVMLDGLNEVQPAALQAKLQDQINQLTNPLSRSARSQWILSGRRYDYAMGRRTVEFLEQNQWVLQPLTPDLIFNFLADGLSGGEQEAQHVYENLGPALMDVCSNPLLLNMILVIHTSRGQLPAGKGQLYRDFIGLLLEWGNLQTKRLLFARLSEITGQVISDQDYREIVGSPGTELEFAL